jgi:hypothetical protein
LRCGSISIGLSRATRDEPLESFESNATRLFSVAAIPLDRSENAFFIDAAAPKLSGLNPLIELLLAGHANHVGDERLLGFAVKLESARTDALGVAGFGGEPHPRHLPDHVWEQP